MKIIRKAPIGNFEKPRRKWDFERFDVGDALDVSDVNAWVDTRRAAHSYASKQSPRWKFTARWYAKEGFGRIRRLK